VTVQLALDTSGVLAYVAGSRGLGELLGEIADEKNQFAVPASALVEAAGMLTDPAWLMLDVLAGHPAAVVTGLDAGEWRRHASASLMFDRAGNGAAALLVAQARALYVATARPHVYGGGVDTILIED
jgi:hypothetical protein